MSALSDPEVMAALQDGTILATFFFRSHLDCHINYRVKIIKQQWPLNSTGVLIHLRENNGNN
jgi:hypothetical protein